MKSIDPKKSWFAIYQNNAVRDVSVKTNANLSRRFYTRRNVSKSALGI